LNSSLAFISAMSVSVVLTSFPMVTSTEALPVVMEPPEPPEPPVPPEPPEALPPVPETLAAAPAPPAPAAPPEEAFPPVLADTETVLLTVALPPLLTLIVCANAAGAPKSVRDSIAISEVIFFM
jgi:hypothetical protein